MKTTIIQKVGNTTSSQYNRCMSGYRLKILSGGGGSVVLATFFSHQRISKRAVRNSFEKQLDPRRMHLLEVSVSVTCDFPSGVRGGGLELHILYPLWMTFLISCVSALWWRLWICVQARPKPMGHYMRFWYLSHMCKRLQ